MERVSTDLGSNVTQGKVTDKVFDTKLDIMGGGCKSFSSPGQLGGDMSRGKKHSLYIVKPLNKTCIMSNVCSNNGGCDSIEGLNLNTVTKNGNSCLVVTCSPNILSHYLKYDYLHSKIPHDSHCHDSALFL